MTRTLSGGQERALTAALALSAKLSEDTGLFAESPLPLKKQVVRKIKCTRDVGRVRSGHCGSHNNTSMDRD